MKRQIQLLFLTHLYALFAILHLRSPYRGMTIIVLAHDVPDLIWTFVAMSLLLNKFTRPTTIEKCSLSALITISAFYHVYITICAFSMPLWVWNHNMETSLFIGILSIYYTITLIKLHKKSESGWKQ